MTNEETIEVIENMRDMQLHILGDRADKKEIEALTIAVIALYNQLRWIPCSEKMPEEYEADPIQKAQRIKKVSKRLLATIVTKVDKKPHVVEARTKDGNWYVDHVDLIKPYLGEVTAWMPIPEPYEP